MANILIIKLGALGDIIMSTSQVREILSFHAKDSVFLLTSKPYGSIFRNWPDLNIFTIERKGFLNGLRTIAWIRRGAFKSVYDLQSNDRSGLYCSLSGITRRIGNHPRFPYHVHPDDPYTGQCHSFERINQILVSAGITPGPESPYLPATDKEKLHIEKWLAAAGLASSRFVLLHAGASLKHPAKRWPFFLDLGQRLQSKGLEVVWIGADEDAKLNSTLASKVGINATSLFDFSELAELGRHARFAVTNDSAPMHILSCSGIPVFGLFGPTNWQRAHALGQQHRAITPSTDTNTRGDVFRPQALNKLPVQQVLERLHSDGLI